MGRPAIIGPTIHGPGHGGTQTGYRKDKCRCAECQAWKKADNDKLRGKTPVEQPVTPELVPTFVIAPILASVPAVIAPSPPIPAVPDPAMEAAREDMTGILSALTDDPDCRCDVSEETPGEISQLRGLIDAHNSAGRLPRIQYGYDDGFFRVTASEVVPEPAVVQLPQRMPLARPSNVRAGRTTTVPAVPARAANVMSARAEDDATPGDPVWG
jgi:hypothetical protein